MSFVADILQQLDRDGDRPWVTEVVGSERRPTTAANLRIMVAQARGNLRAAGVVQGDRVVLIGKNSPEWVAADLGMLADRIVSVPLYTRQPAKEICDVLRDCAPTLVLVGDEEILRTLEEETRKHGLSVELRALTTLFVGAGVFEAVRPGSASDLATLIYTSGTSGASKGVQLSFANVAFMLSTTQQALQGLLELPPAQHRVFHYLPFCFAGSRVVLWTCLAQGSGLFLSTDLASLVTELRSAAPHYVLNVPMLLERMRDGVLRQMQDKPKMVRTLYAVGEALFRKKLSSGLNWHEQARLAFIEALVFRSIARAMAGELRTLICGSAPLSVATQQWFNMVGFRVLQVYGLTETTAIVSLDDPEDIQPGCVGKVIEGCEVRVESSGELLVKGPNVFAGYFRREEETKQAFLDGDWFRTGDACEIDTRGRLRIIGRIKNTLVLVNGHNVAPEGVEEALVQEIPGVEHAVVFGHGEPALVAVVAGKVSQAALKAGLEKYNAKVVHYRRVKDVVLATEAWTADAGFLTANQKVRRHVVEAAYRSQLERAFRGMQQHRESAQPRAQRA